MQASAWKNTGSKIEGQTYGIRVGFPNRDEHFKGVGSSIRVEIEGTEYTFEITGGFWNKCPEFRDDAAGTIRKWLERHHSLTWDKGQPPRFELTRVAQGRYRLES
ncbi:MAG: hypothetical protein K8U57_27355 [Planctomycetes bacterium]|nr:hypothetical protein [Planctomycetota bacterium]